MSGTNGNGHGKTGEQTAVKTADKQRKMPKGRPFQKGQSGNPKGRPPRRELVGDHFRQFLDKIDPEDPKRRRRLDLVALKLYKEDLKTLLAYSFGKPSEMVEIAQVEGAPFEFVVRLKPEEMP